MSIFHCMVTDYLWEESPDKIPMLDPIHAGVNGKTSVPVGLHVPIASVQNQLVRPLVASGTKIEAADHSLYCEKLIPSVIQSMNKFPNPGDSLFSGGVNGNGRTFISIHDAALYLSSVELIMFILFFTDEQIMLMYEVPCSNSGYKHATHFVEFAHHLAYGRPLPHGILIEDDDRPDHNLTHLANQLSLFDMFLSFDINVLRVVKGCPGLLQRDLCHL